MDRQRDTHIERQKHRKTDMCRQNKSSVCAFIAAMPSLLCDNAAAAVCAALAAIAAFLLCATAAVAAAAADLATISARTIF